jgi:signal transduction histidine kinase
MGAGAAVIDAVVPSPGWRERGWVALLVAGAAGSIAYALVPLPWPPVLYVAVGLLVAVLMAASLRGRRGPIRRVWTVMTTALFLSVAGDVAQFTAGEQPWLQVIGEGAYLASYLALIAGLVLLAISRGVRWRTALVVDAAIVAATFGLLLLLAPMTAAPPSLLLHPVLGMFILGLAIPLALVPITQTSSDLLGLGGLAALFLGDLLLVVLGLGDVVTMRIPPDAPWLAAKLLVGAAALHPSSDTLPALSPRVPRGRPALLVAAFLAVPPLLAIAAVRDRRAPWEAVGMTAVLVVLLAVRVLGSLREAERRADAARAEAALRERAHLAREIHDVLAHGLVALVLQLDSARTVARGGDPALADQLEQAARQARRSLQEVRGAVVAMRGDAVPGPELLPRLIEDFRTTSGLAVELRMDGEVGALAPLAKLTVYRAVQEALTNVQRHAGDDVTVTVTVVRAADAVELTVEDRGRRDPPVATPPSGSGLGLAGLRERAELVGGVLSAGPTSDGFRLHLSLPTDGPPPQPPGRVHGPSPAPAAGRLTQEA